eukprot:6378520-Ditylum_brightwellii.AAC.1
MTMRVQDEGEQKETTAKTRSRNGRSKRIKPHSVEKREPTVDDFAWERTADDEDSREPNVEVELLPTADDQSVAASLLHFTTALNRTASSLSEMVTQQKTPRHKYSKPFMDVPEHGENDAPGLYS